MNGLKYLIKKISWVLSGGYREQIFWEKWGEKLINDPWQHKIHNQHELILKVIRSENPKSILEVGSGFGRNIKWLIENGVKAEIITGTDISTNMLKQSKKYIDNHRVNLRKADVLNLPFKNNAFDLVLVFAVLMHVKPSQIKNALSEIKRVSGKSIIIVEQNYLSNAKFEASKWYTFLHDYRNIFSGLSFVILDYKKSNILDYFHIKKEDSTSIS